MAEYKDSRGVRCFTPDDTDTEIYIRSHYESKNLGFILETAREKWGNDINIEDLEIQPEYIHEEALGYDRYDSSDYACYLRIEYTPPKEKSKEAA